MIVRNALFYGFSLLTIIKNGITVARVCLCVQLNNEEIKIKRIALPLLATLLVYVSPTYANPEQNRKGWVYPTGSSVDPGNYWDWRHPKYEVHIGDDWKHDFTENKPVYAISNGIIRAYKWDAEFYGDNCGGEGGALSVEHVTSSGRKVFALYGHNYIENGLTVGSHVNAGQIIGRSHKHYQASWNNGVCTLGSRSDHLHFGIKLDSADPNPYRGRASVGDDMGWVEPKVFMAAYSPGSIGTGSTTGNTNSSNESSNNSSGGESNTSTGSSDPVIAFDFSDKEIRDSNGNKTSKIYNTDPEMMFSFEIENEGDHEFSGSAYACGWLDLGDNPDLTDCKKIDGDDLEPGDDMDVTITFDTPTQIDDYDIKACIHESEPDDDSDYDHDTKGALACSSYKGFNVVDESNQLARGYVDNAGSCSTFAGWAFEPDSPELSAWVRVRVNGGILWQGDALQDRPDVASVVTPTTKGFSVTVPTAYRDNASRTVTAHVVDMQTGQEQELSGSPYTLTCAPPTPTTPPPTVTDSYATSPCGSAGYTKMQCAAIFSVIFD